MLRNLEFERLHPRTRKGEFAKKFGAARTMLERLVKQPGDGSKSVYGHRVEKKGSTLHLYDRNGNLVSQHHVSDTSAVAHSIASAAAAGAPSPMRGKASPATGGNYDFPSRGTSAQQRLRSRPGGPRENGLRSWYVDSSRVKGKHALIAPSGAHIETFDHLADAKKEADLRNAGKASPVSLYRTKKAHARTMRQLSRGGLDRKTESSLRSKLAELEKSIASDRRTGSITRARLSYATGKASPLTADYEHLKSTHEALGLPWDEAAMKEKFGLTDGALTIEKPAGGTTGAMFAKDAAGNRWLVKRYKGDQNRVATEFLANQVYQTVGAKVPKGQIRNVDGQMAYVYKAEPGTPGSNALRVTKPSEALGKHFMTDALLANWDVVGLEHDNLLWPEGTTQAHIAKGDLEPIRLDQGGTLQYRAQGAKKEFGPIPTEVITMLEGGGQGNGTMAVSEEDKLKQAAHIAKVLTPDKVDQLVDQAPFASEQMREEVRSALKGRVLWMATLVANHEASKQPHPVLDKAEVQKHVAAATGGGDAPAKAGDKGVPMHKIPVGSVVKVAGHYGGGNVGKVGTPITVGDHPTEDVRGRYRDIAGQWDYVMPTSKFDVVSVPEGKVPHKLFDPFNKPSAEQKAAASFIAKDQAEKKAATRGLPGPDIPDVVGAITGVPQGGHGVHNPYSVGRGPKGNIRNVAAMGDTKLMGEYEKVLAEYPQDPEVVAAFAAEVKKRGLAESLVEARVRRYEYTRRQLETATGSKVVRLRARLDAIEATLTGVERKKLPSSAFAIPEKRAYPIHDESHARAALTMVARHGTPEEKARVRAAVARRYPNIKVSGATKKLAKAA